MYPMTNMYLRMPYLRMPMEKRDLPTYNPGQTISLVDRFENIQNGYLSFSPGQSNQLMERFPQLGQLGLNYGTKPMLKLPTSDMVLKPMSKPGPVPQQEPQVDQMPQQRQSPYVNSQVRGLRRVIESGRQALAPEDKEKFFRMRETQGVDAARDFRRRRLVPISGLR